jgi:hypothetical protein
MQRSNTQRSWTALAPLCLLWAVGALSASASAQDAKVSGEVTVILAKEPEGEYDPKLKQLPALQKAPFNSFKSMKVLSTSQVELTADSTPTVALPNGRTLQLKLVEKMPDGRHKVQVSINRPGKQDYLPLLTVIASGEPFFVAGQSYEGGTLVIGVRVSGGAAPAPKK